MKYKAGDVVWFDGWKHKIDTIRHYDGIKPDYFVRLDMYATKNIKPVFAKYVKPVVRCYAVLGG